MQESYSGSRTSTKKKGMPRLEPDLLNWSRTKRGSRGGRRDGGGRSKGGGRDLVKESKMKSLYTTEEIMDCLGLSEAELQQIKGLGLSEEKVQQIEDVDVVISQDVGISIQITIDQALGDEEMMNEEDGIDEPGMSEVMRTEERMDGEREIPITQQSNQLRRRPTKRSKVN
ncbi:unnamed protein product [Lactuca saligna]|uniref:Uncharacterized protein n=1 Tax=Lactuca saligna TaxID=75948 RepID=A0AA35VWV6_LACSI|nr:unnamed protein product [Lactuca saligna]